MNAVSLQDRLERPLAGLAFDQMAAEYDASFTCSTVGRSQRGVVWKHALEVFSPGDHVLELNCGTGEDALFLASHGMSVAACDASESMIAEALERKRVAGGNANVTFFVLPTEDVDTLPHSLQIDGVFSNFSGLNCVGDLPRVAQQLSRRLRPGAPLLFCLSTRYCVWEMAYYLWHRNPRKAFRRCSGVSQAHIGELCFPVFYPTVAELRRAFAPAFQLRSVTGVGITVPPSYVEGWMVRHPRLLRGLQGIDSVIHNWPVARVLGDHMLLHFTKVIA